MRGNSAREKRKPCRTATPRSNRKARILYASALTNQPLTHAVERLQIKLLGGLCRDELHRRALHCLGDGLRIAEIVLLPPRVGPHIFGWHQPSVVFQHLQPAAEVMRPDASLHTD
jgi:hypothetical protein